MLKKVVLPAPFGPIRLTIEPRGMANSTSLTATRPPNSLRMPEATRRSVIGRASVRVGPLVGDVVERRVAHALLQLALVPSLRDQPRGPEQHDDDDDQAVDAEVVLRHVLDADLRPDLREAFLVEVREEQPADDRAPDAAHPAEDDHAEDEDREVEVEVARERAALERRVVGAGDPAEERADRIGPGLRSEERRVGKECSAGSTTE